MPDLGNLLNSSSLTLSRCPNLKPVPDHCDSCLSSVETLAGEGNWQVPNEDGVRVSDFRQGRGGKGHRSLDEFVKDWVARKVESGVPERKCFLPFLVGSPRMVECCDCQNLVHPGEEVLCSALLHAAFHNEEHNGDGSQFSPLRIMNPHAAEFVPGYPWVPNGLYPVSPNGYLAYSNLIPLSPNGYLAYSNLIPLSPNGYPLPPNGIPVSPNGFQPSLNGVPVTQNGFPISPVSPVESPTVTVEVSADENQSQDVAEDDMEKSSVDMGNSNDSIEQEAPDVQSADDEKCHPEIEENHVDRVTVVEMESSDNVAVDRRKTKQVLGELQ